MGRILPLVKLEASPVKFRKWYLGVIPAPSAAFPTWSAGLAKNLSIVVWLRPCAVKKSLQALLVGRRMVRGPLMLPFLLSAMWQSGVGGEWVVGCG